MAKYSCYTLFFLLICTFSFGALPQKGPSGLMVEFLRNPADGSVNNPQPHFSWIPNQPQKSYQILVSSTRQKLAAGIGDLWNSGKIASDQSVGVQFSGSPLKPNGLYFWQITCWNDGSAIGSKSEIQGFRTGIFENGATTSVMPLTKNLFKPVQVIERNHRGNYFADFGKAAFGTLRVQVESQDEDSVVVYLGEKLFAPASIHRNPGGTIRYRCIVIPVGKGIQWYTVTIPHIERNSKYPAIVMPAVVGEVTPFRYCEIEARTSKTACKGVEQVAVNYFWDQSESSFTCSDTILNKVWDLCKYSIKATTFCGVYVDGDRERIPYEADAYINQLGHYCTDREYSLARYSHEYLMVNPTWPTEWIMHSVMMAYTDYLYTGDTQSLARFYKDLKNKTLTSLAREDGLISTQTGLLNETILNGIHMKAPIRDIVDWPLVERDGNDMPKISTVINAFHYESLRLMSLIANALDNREDELFYKNREEAVKSAINQKLFDPIGKKYFDGEGSKHSSLHANIFPAAFGLVPAAVLPDVAKFISSKGMACSVYGAQFLLESLYAAGEETAALDLMRATNDRSWWNMIKSGSTITLEAWDARFKPNLDWNHAWGAVPANMVTRGLWGVVPLSPGFAVAQIKPQTGGLTSSAIRVPTIRGSINCEFKTDNLSKFELFVSVPSNMKTVTCIPVREIENPVLLVDGKAVKGIRNGRYFIVETGGGQFRYTVQEGIKQTKL